VIGYDVQIVGHCQTPIEWIRRRLPPNDLRLNGPAKPIIDPETDAGKEVRSRK